MFGRKRKRRNPNSMIEVIEILTKIVKRQKQNKKIKSILQNGNKWRENGKFEQKLIAEMKSAELFEEQLSDFITCFKEPVETTITNRLSERYYEPITLQILSLTTFHSGTLLAKKVFDQIPNETVMALVSGLIAIPDYQHSLAQLHYSFDNRYWEQRYEIVCKTSYYYERLVKPENIGLIHFADLLTRHENLINWKSNVKTSNSLRVGELGNSASDNERGNFHREIYLNSMVGNNYVLHTYNNLMHFSCHDIDIDHEYNEVHFRCVCK